MDNMLAYLHVGYDNRHDVCNWICTTIDVNHTAGVRMSGAVFNALLYYLVNFNKQMYCIVALIERILIIVDYNIPNHDNMTSIFKIIPDVHWRMFVKLCDKFIKNRNIITDVHLQSLIASQKCNMATYMLNYITPNDMCLENACCHGTITEFVVLIRKILQSNVHPTRECFNRLMCKTRVHDPKCKQAENVADIVDLFIEYGYKLTYDDILVALKYGWFIRNIHRFDIVYKDEFLEQCALQGFYPYDIEDIKVKPTVRCLYHECNKTFASVSNIKMLILWGSPVDIECLRLACQHNNNIEVIKYLIDVQKLVVDIDCLKNYAKKNGVEQLSFLVENLNKKVDYSSDDEYADVQEGEDADQPVTIKSDVKIIREMKAQSKVNLHTKTKYLLKGGAAILFKLKKDAKLTGLDARTYLINYINDNKLFGIDDPTLIKLDKNLGNVLDFDEHDYVRFSDIKNIVSALFV